MPDLYDKLIHLLGLDDIRLDRIVGRPLHEIGSFPGAPRYQHSPVKISLCELPDGRRQWGFEWSTQRPNLAMIPITPRNRERLRAWIAEARRLLEIRHLRPEGSPGLLKRTGDLLMGEILSDHGTLPDASPHVQCALLIRRFENCGNFLVFRFSGRGRIDASVLAQPTILDTLEEAFNEEPATPSQSSQPR